MTRKHRTDYFLEIAETSKKISNLPNPESCVLTAKGNRIITIGVGFISSHQQWSITCIISSLLNCTMPNSIEFAYCTRTPTQYEIALLYETSCKEIIYGNGERINIHA